MARAAASKAGPSGLVVHHGTAPSGFTVTCTPQGGFSLSRLTRRSRISLGFWLGTIRMQTLARAESTIWFEDPLIGEASRAMIVRAGRVQSLSYTLNCVSPFSLRPFTSPPSERNFVSLKGSALKRARSLAVGLRTSL